MGRAVGWMLIVLLIVLIANHPDTVIGFAHVFVTVLQRAGDELSAFINGLTATPTAPTPTPAHTSLPVTG